MRDRWGSSSLMASNRFQVRVPKVDVDGDARLTVPPQLLGREAHRVERLGYALGGVGLDIGKVPLAVEPGDHADLPAHITRAAGVARAVHVPDAHGISDTEATGVGWRPGHPAGL